MDDLRKVNRSSSQRNGGLRITGVFRRKVILDKARYGESGLVGGRYADGYGRMKIERGRGRGGMEGFKIQRRREKRNITSFSQNYALALCYGTAAACSLRGITQFASSCQRARLFNSSFFFLFSSLFFLPILAFLICS